MIVNGSSTVRCVEIFDSSNGDYVCDDGVCFLCWQVIFCRSRYRTLLLFCFGATLLFRPEYHEAFKWTASTCRDRWSTVSRAVSLYFHFLRSLSRFCKDRKKDPIEARRVTMWLFRSDPLLRSAIINPELFQTCVRAGTPGDDKIVYHAVLLFWMLSSAARTTAGSRDRIIVCREQLELMTPMARPATDPFLSYEKDDNMTSINFFNRR